MHLPAAAATAGFRPTAPPEIVCRGRPAGPADRLAGWWRTLAADAHPSSGARLARFRAAVDSLPQQTRSTRVAVIGVSPGEGRSTVAALVARAAATFTDRRVLVVDAGRTLSGGHPAARGMSDGVPVTALLGGAPASGRLSELLQYPPGRPVPRARLAAAHSPGARPAAIDSDLGSFAPQMLEQLLGMLSYRADLTLIDTPAGGRSPVVYAALHGADQVVLVARADSEVERRVGTVRSFLTRAPGAHGDPSVSVALVQHGAPAPWRPTDLPWIVVGRSRALRRGEFDLVPGSPEAAAGLRLLHLLSRPDPHARVIRRTRA